MRHGRVAWLGWALALGLGAAAAAGLGTGRLRWDRGGGLVDHVTFDRARGATSADAVRIGGPGSCAGDAWHEWSDGAPEAALVAMAASDPAGVADCAAVPPTVTFTIPKVRNASSETPGPLTGCSLENVYRGTRLLRLGWDGGAKNVMLQFPTVEDLDVAARALAAGALAPHLVTVDVPPAGAAGRLTIAVRIEP